MDSLPALVQVTAHRARQGVVLRARPSSSAPVVGEARSGLHLPPLAQSADRGWWAVSWAGGTAWLPVSAARPVAGVSASGRGPSQGLAFDWPVGPSDQRSGGDPPSGWYVALGFNQEYQSSRGRRSVHPGIDLNLRSGGDTDLGQPVLAAADGEVVASGTWPVWGNLVLLRHPLPGGGFLWTQYAHLAQRYVGQGDAVGRGQQIGTIGKGDGRRFLAHLHFEIRQREVPAAYWPGADRPAVLRNYVDPLAVLGQAATTTHGDEGTLLGAIDPDDALLTAMRSAGGGWVGRTVLVDVRADSNPSLAVPDDGLRHVLHLLPAPVEEAPPADWASVPRSTPLTPAFARTAAAIIRKLDGEPWAVLLGGDWDIAAWSAGQAPDPAVAAAGYNLAADLVRQALVETDRAAVLLGPGPLARRTDTADPVPFWRHMLAAASTIDVLAVPAWTFGDGATHVPAPPQSASSPAADDGFHRYWRLLAAVPHRWRSRPALLYGVDPTEPRRAQPTGWLTAVADDVRYWNTVPQGPTVRGVLVHRPSRAETPLLTAAPREPAAVRHVDHLWSGSLTSGDDWRQCWQGKGLLVAAPWPLAGMEPGAVARSWRAAGLAFVALRMVPDGPAVGPNRPVVQALVAAGAGNPQVWAWCPLPGQSPEVEAAQLVETAHRLGVCGWILELAAGRPAAVAATVLRRLRQDRGALPIGLTWRPETPPNLIGDLAPLADVLLPQVRGAGTLGAAQSALIRFGRPVVPVLQPEDANLEGVTVFLRHARAIGLPGAALLVTQTALGPGDETAAALRGMEWPRSDHESFPPTDEGEFAHV